jgi:hypothetical protein
VGNFQMNAENFRIDIRKYGGVLFTGWDEV